jgi:hypothetical protein
MRWLQFSPPPPQKRLLVLISVLNKPQGHLATGKIRLMEKTIGHVENQSCDLPAYSVAPQTSTLLLTY